MKITKKYIAVWTYMANYGYNEIEGTSAQEVLENHLFYNRKDISLFVFENNKESSAVKLAEGK